MKIKFKFFGKEEKDLDPKEWIKLVRKSAKNFKQYGINCDNLENFLTDLEKALDEHDKKINYFLVTTYQADVKPWMEKIRAELEGIELKVKQEIESQP